METEGNYASFQLLAQIETDTNKTLPSVFPFQETGMWKWAAIFLCHLRQSCVASFAVGLFDDGWNRLIRSADTKHQDPSNTWVLAPVFSEKGPGQESSHSEEPGRVTRLDPAQGPKLFRSQQLAVFPGFCFEQSHLYCIIPKECLKNPHSFQPVRQVNWLVKVINTTAVCLRGLRWRPRTLNHRPPTITFNEPEFIMIPALPQPFSIVLLLDCILFLFFSSLSLTFSVNNRTMWSLLKPGKRKSWKTTFQLHQ